MFCTDKDVEKRLRRDLTPDEEAHVEDMIEEAELLVVAYLGCGQDPYPDAVPDAVRIVTSRMVARVIQEDEASDPDLFGAEQASMTAGPYTQQATFASGSRTGAPWLTRVDKSTLDPYRCSGKAFAVDTAPGPGTVHAEGCSAINYQGLPGSYWPAYCTCGADIAGFPIFGVTDEG